MDLLVLPELAFTGMPMLTTCKSCFQRRTDTNGVIGYKFESLQHISPYLEHAGSGISSLWGTHEFPPFPSVYLVGCIALFLSDLVDMSKLEPLHSG